MELANEQWNQIEPIIASLTPVKDPGGRKARDPRQLLTESYGFCELVLPGGIFHRGIRAVPSVPSALPAMA